MDDARIGRSLRALRQRRGLRQSEVAVAAGVRLRGDGPLEGRRPRSAAGRAPRWLVAASVRRLGDLGWDTRLETTYSIFGERGSIDVLGALPAVRAVLVEEIKSELGSLEETIRKLDEKVRFVRERIAESGFGRRPSIVGRLLVLPDTSMARSRVAGLDPVLGVAFPDRGSKVRAWLRAPEGGLAGILFQPVIATGDRKNERMGVQRVRGPRPDKFLP